MAAVTLQLSGSEPRMGATWARRLAPVFVVLLGPIVARGEGPDTPDTAAPAPVTSTPVAEKSGSSSTEATPPTPATPPSSAAPKAQPAGPTSPASDAPRGPATPKPQTTGATPPAPSKPAPPPKAAPAAPAAPATEEEPIVDPEATPVDLKAVRAELGERLKALADAPGKTLAAGDKALREILEERVQWLDKWDAAYKERQAVEHPQVDPVLKAGELKAELAKYKSLLEQAAKNPAGLLTNVFKKPAAQVDEALCAEMRDAIADTKADLRDARTRLDRLRAEKSTKGSTLLTELRTKRDKQHQQVASLKPRRAEREAACASAKTPDDKVLADERLANFDWEARVQTETFLALRARVSLEIKRDKLAEQGQQVEEAHAKLASKTLEVMQSTYQTLSNNQQNTLKKAAANAQKRADLSNDPLDRYRARWTAQLLELQAQVLKNENALASSIPPTLEEQWSLANAADTDLGNLKNLLDDDRVSHLDAVRFNNEFRRIGPLRAKIVANELAAATRQLAYYENALSSAEYDISSDVRADQYEHEILLEQLPASRHAEARAAFVELDRQHLELLNKNRDALENLAKRCELTLDQITRRLRVLDDQYGFILTHIFWVRDQEPLGPTALAQSQREVLLVGKSIARLSVEAANPTLWGRVSAEFLAAVTFLVLLPWPMSRLRIALERRLEESRRTSSWLSSARVLLVGVSYSAVWPSYVGLLAYAVRQGPWPRSVALPIAAGFAIVVPLLFLAGLLRWMLRPGGWAEVALSAPQDVPAQLRKSVPIVAALLVPLFVPRWLLDQGLIAPSGRPISASSLSRLLGLGIEVVLLGVVIRLIAGQSPLSKWLIQCSERFGWLNRRRRIIFGTTLVGLGGVIALDALGYSFTAIRLSIAIGQGLVVFAGCWAFYLVLLRAIDNHAWRWIRTGHATPSAETPPAASNTPDDLANRLRRLVGYLVPVLGVFVTAWVWNVDWTFFEVVGKQQLWTADQATKTPVTVGDLFECAVVLGLTASVWVHMNTFFAVAVFPRMRDDPGVRFAVVTLCRYAVLGVGLLAGLSSIHLGLEKIGVVLAALGVGLGFGLQEIVSNFICGIILLLERPIRVDDVVTVSGMTGKVDRINIRATTIINGDNQSIIVPNRAFITTDLINWTLKDKVIRVSIRMKVAHGTDPDVVTDLLLKIAREDVDVLRNPLPVAFMEDFSDSALLFVLHVHVPDPSLGSRVRHRLLSQVQKRFVEADIVIPLPTHALRLQNIGEPALRASETVVDFHRLDRAEVVPPPPRFTNIQPVPAAVEDCHRGVDE